MVRGGAGSARRERAALRRDLERLTFLRRQGDVPRAGALAAAVVDQAGRLGAELSLSQALELGMALADIDRVADVTQLLRSALEFIPPDTPDSDTNPLRMLLVAAAEEAGQFRLALLEGNTLLSKPSVSRRARSNVHAQMAEAERQLGHLDACHRHLDLAAYELSAVPVDDASAENVAFVSALRGLLAQSAGDPVTADAHMRVSLGSPGLVSSRSLVQALAADVLLDVGDLANATALLDAAARESTGGLGHRSAWSSSSAPVPFGSPARSTTRWGPSIGPKAI